MIRWRSCASWAAARPPPSSARSWPRACRRFPVLLDGYAACAAAAVLRAVEPDRLDHCLAAHVSPRRAMPACSTLDKRPLLALDIGDEEGVGGASALALVKLACEVR
jgi:nicotinate-nucleotide--dimethylbenzimidazole phosphoribosyltransferase